MFVRCNPTSQATCGMTPTDETRWTHPLGEPPILQRKWIGADGKAVWRDEARAAA